MRLNVAYQKRVESVEKATRPCYVLHERERERETAQSTIDDDVEIVETVCDFLIRLSDVAYHS
jgi:hypothetical protein